MQSEHSLQSYIDSCSVHSVVKHMSEFEQQNINSVDYGTLEDQIMQSCHATLYSTTQLQQEAGLAVKYFTDKPI